MLVQYLTMNRTFSDVLTTGQLLPLINDFKLFIPIALVSSLGLISTFGLVSNIVNLIVFVKLVLKDSIAVEIFSLTYQIFGSVA
ncbi:hypothetical protein BgiBS90_034815 [Biomphalaria glabrata]|nr:hypothetical protein BgiBS90_034815 [Biomphalaria glabrata]